MSLPPKREKRKRRPSPPHINPMPYIIVILLAFFVTIGLAIFLVLTMQNRAALQAELDAQRLMLAVLSQTPNASPTPFPTQPPAFTTTPTFTPSPFPSSTPLPIASPTPTPLSQQPVIPGDVLIFDPINMLADNGEPCFGHWVPSVWEELNVKPDLQQAFAGLDFIQVEVFGQGYVCFDNNGGVNMGDSRTLHTDFYFVVDVETTDLVGVAPDLTDAADTPQREKLGSLARLILDRLEGFRGYEQPPAFSSVIHITFTSGEVFRTLHFTWANAYEWPINEFVAGAVTSLLGTGLGDLYTTGA